MENLIRNYFLFFENVILPKIKNISWVTQKDYWYHWLLTHTEWVVFRGIYLSLSMSKDPIPVIFACAAHDLARTTDWDCEKHWPNAVPIVEKLMNMFDGLLSNDEKLKVKYAVKNHTKWTIAPDYISACLWDADRIRLSWEMWYEEKFFNTSIWKKIASWRAKEFLEFENKCLLRNKSVDNEKVLKSGFSIRRTPIIIYNKIIHKN